MFYVEDFLGLSAAKPAGCANILQDHTVTFFREKKAKLQT
jgi:hypothetical protein